MSATPTPLFQNGFPVLKPMVAVDISDLKIQMPQPTSDPFETSAWKEIEQAIDEIRRESLGVHHGDKDKGNDKKRRDRPEDDEEGSEDGADDDVDEDDELKEAADDGDCDSDDDEDIRMALATQREIDRSYNIFHNPLTDSIRDWLDGDKTSSEKHRYNKID